MIWIRKLKKDRKLNAFSRHLNYALNVLVHVPKKKNRCLSGSIVCGLLFFVIVNDGEHDFGFQAEFAVNSGDAFAFANFPTETGDFHFQTELVAGTHLTADAAIVNTGKQRKAAFVLRHLQHCHAANLR